MTLPALLLYISSVLLYAAAYGGDVVIAMINRTEAQHAGSPAVATVRDAMVTRIDGALRILRVAAFISIGGFCLAKIPLNTGAYLALGALLCMVFRTGIPVTGAILLGKALPLLSIRASISAIGMFYLVAAALAR